MALTSNDETDLLLPLYRGLQESPPFATFLNRLRRRTQARNATLVVEDSISLTAHWLIPVDPAARQRLRPFRVYALAEVADIVAAGDGLLVPPIGMVDARIVRIPLTDDISGWLVIVSDRPCSASAGALLSSIAPYVQSVLTTAHDIERERAAAALSASGMSRAGTGWILFDADSRILAIDAQTRDRLAILTGIAPIEGERLRGLDAGAERRLADAAGRMAGGQDHAVLLANPRVDAVLKVIDPHDDIALHYPAAAMIAWCRFDIPLRSRRADAFAGLYELPQREAELALALADGLSIAEAATAMNLTLETARNYSKRLYAKLEVSGQAQLVRLVHRSGAILA